MTSVIEIKDACSKLYLAEALKALDPADQGEVDFMKLQDLYSLELSNCFYTLIALIYLVEGKSYEMVFPIMKKLMSSSKYL